MRVLGRIRLSRLTEESTSAARQRDIIEAWAENNGHTIVGWAEDLDVSGAVDPFDTPALGDWLTHRPHDFDYVVAWKLDRLGRNSIKLNKLFGWAIDNHKTIVSCSEGIDLSTPVGRLIANVIAFLAEGELEAMRERSKASRKKLLESGRWPGGAVPYGTQPLELPGGGWVLQPDPDTAPVVRRMVDEVVSGASVESVTARLREDGIKAPRGGDWNRASVWGILESKYLIGHATYHGDTVRDTAGMPVLNCEPLISQDTWDRLLSALAARRVESSRTRDVSPLYQVAVCGVCERPLYHRVYNRKPPKSYRYYVCRDNTHCDMIEAAQIEELVEQTFMETYGDRKVTERIFVPAENHQTELDAAIRAVDELTPLAGTATSTTMRSRLTEQLRALDFRIATLENLPISEAGWVYKETHETFTDRWNTSTNQERRQLLIDAGITASVIYKNKTLRFDLTQKIPPK